MSESIQHEREIIKKFIKERQATPQFVLQLAEKLSAIATISPSGDVLIERRCPIKDRVASIVIARFLGNLLETKTNIPIRAEVTREEVSKYAGIDKTVSSARLKELKDEGLIDSPSRGVFKVRSLSKAERWVDKLCKKHTGRK